MLKLQILFTGLSLFTQGLLQKITTLKYPAKIEKSVKPKVMSQQEIDAEFSKMSPDDREKLLQQLGVENKEGHAENSAEHELLLHKAQNNFNDALTDIAKLLESAHNSFKSGTIDKSLSYYFGEIKRFKISLQSSFEELKNKKIISKNEEKDFNDKNKELDDLKKKLEERKQASPVLKVSAEPITQESPSEQIDHAQFEARLLIDEINETVTSIEQLANRAKEPESKLTITAIKTSLSLLENLMERLNEKKSDITAEDFKKYGTLIRSKIEILKNLPQVLKDEE